MDFGSIPNFCRMAFVYRVSHLIAYISIVPLLYKGFYWEFSPPKMPTAWAKSGGCPPRAQRMRLGELGGLLIGHPFGLFQ